MGQKKLVVADIHGQISIFQHIYDYILDVTRLNKKIEIGFVGDYADRGEAGEFNGKAYEDIGSRLVYEKLMALENHFKTNKIPYFFLKGNHERDMLGLIEDKKTTLKNTEAIKKAYAGICAEPSIEGDIKAFIERMPLYRADKRNRLLFVHAGVDPEEGDILQSDPAYFLWARTHFFESKRRYPYRVIFGHTKMSVPFVKEDRIGIDGGAYENGWLNVLLMDGKKAKIISFNAEGDIITRYEEE